MTTPALAPITAAARLRAALEATASSLARPDLDGLLAAESELTRACANLPFLRDTLAGKTHASVGAVFDELVAAQAALGRARRLGATLSDFVRTSLDARGQATGYDPTGAAAALSGRAFQTRA
jgi:hypothetical protein